jgi:hypothetical protein
MDESGGGKRTRPKRWDVAGLPAGVALDYGATGREWWRGVPGASRGTAGLCVGTPSGTARSGSPSVRAAGEGEGLAVAGADVVKSKMLTSQLCQLWCHQDVNAGSMVRI